MGWTPCQCSRPECDNCASSQSPDTWTVTVSGMADDNCTDCSDWDGTYVVDWQAGCTWRVNIASGLPTYAAPFCGVSTNTGFVQLGVESDGGSPEKYRISLILKADHAILPNIRIDGPWESSISCCTYSRNSGWTVTATDGACTPSSATITVTGGNDGSLCP